MSDKPYRVLCASNTDRATWLELRRSGVGASEVPALMGVDPYCDAATLLARKLGLVEPDQENKYMFWGSCLEHGIIDGYAEIGERLGGEYTPLIGRTAEAWGELVESTSQPRLRCTPDAHQMDTRRPDQGVLQIKTSSNGSTLTDAYRMQVQAELAVTGLEWGTLACLTTQRDLRWWDMERDETLIAEIFDRVKRFWRLVELKKEAA